MRRGKFSALASALTYAIAGSHSSYQTDAAPHLPNGLPDLLRGDQRSCANSPEQGCTQCDVLAPRTTHDSSSAGAVVLWCVALIDFALETPRCFRLAAWSHNDEGSTAASQALVYSHLKINLTNSLL